MSDNWWGQQNNQPGQGNLNAWQSFSGGNTGARTNQDGSWWQQPQQSQGGYQQIGGTQALNQGGRTMWNGNSPSFSKMMWNGNRPSFSNASVSQNRLSGDMAGGGFQQMGSQLQQSGGQQQTGVSPAQQQQWTQAMRSGPGGVVQVGEDPTQTGNFVPFSETYGGEWATLGQTQENQQATNPPGWAQMSGFNAGNNAGGYNQQLMKLMWGM